MPVRKTVIRASAVALIPMFLSGCGIPIGVSIASWVIDGISLAATEKSVSDHGISGVAQKDCALWRIFKGDPICRETVASIELAAVAKLDDEDDNFEQTGSSKSAPVTSIQVASVEAVSFPIVTAHVNEDPFDDEDDNFPHVVKASPIVLAMIEMEAQKLATFNTAAGYDNTAAGSETKITRKTAQKMPMPLPGIKATYHYPQVSQEINQKSIIVADAKGGSGLISRPLPPPAPLKIKTVNRSKMKTRLLMRQVRSKPIIIEQPVNHEPIAIPDAPKPVTSQKPKRAVTKRIIQKPVIHKRAPIKRAPVVRHVGRPAQALPGLYYVLGSFSVQKNANRMATRAKRLSPKIVVAYPKGKRVHRVLVGPFAKSQQPRIRAKIRSTKIRGVWILRMKTAQKTEGTSSEQLAALPRLHSHQFTSLADQL